MPRQKDPRRGEGKADPSYFTGFPYILTHVVKGFHHVILLPADFGRADLEEIALRQVLANRLMTCLVLGETDCVYYGLDGTAMPSRDIPRFSLGCSGRLFPSIGFVEGPEIKARRAVFGEFIRSRQRNATLFGDMTKGGRDATPEELARLEGFARDNIPKGLGRCWRCGEWRGECLDPNPKFKGKIMRVTCRCMNDNRCARCGEGLEDHKLNSNYFDPADGIVWHVPSFAGLKHRCPDLVKEKEQEERPGFEIIDCQNPQKPG